LLTLTVGSWRANRRCRETVAAKLVPASSDVSEMYREPSEEHKRNIKKEEKTISKHTEVNFQK
jgi:hypothetical protein